MESNTISSEGDLLLTAAREAGEIAMKYFSGNNQVWYKNGNSPVSEADKHVDQHLHQVLTSCRPDYGWLSEEKEDNLQRLDKQRIFVVDPIDGTRGFIDQRKEWCISIAVVEGGRPIEAVLHCPALNRTFSASAGRGLKIAQDQTHSVPVREQPIVTGSKKINNVLSSSNKGLCKVLDFIPSLAYRLALVASGEIDGAYARGGACEWDLAAADLLLVEAGCRVTDAGGQMLSYNNQHVGMPPLVAATEGNHAEIMKLAESLGILH